MDGADFETLRASAEQASKLLKALANQDRLMLLCLLAESEKSVSQLEAALEIRHIGMPDGETESQTGRS